MGSFNVACSISNMSINFGEPIVYIPLELSPYRYHVGDGNHFLIQGHCFYYPATFPLKGSYDDYGRIEDIERDENIKFLEKHFDRPIEKLWNCQENESIEQVKSGMFVHREIYDALINNIYDEFGKKSAKAFIPTRKNLEAEYDLIEKKIQEIISDESPLSEIYKDKLTGEVKGLWLEMECQYSALLFRNYKTLKGIAKEAIKQNKLKDTMIDFALFEYGMYAVNAFYFPAMNGFQCGNHYMSRVLYKTALKIVNQTIRERR